MTNLDLAGFKTTNGRALSGDLCDLSAEDAAAGIKARELSSTELVDACLHRIAQREPTVRAWSFLDPDRAIEGARLADDWAAASLPLGPLHGVPIGIKDVFDTVEYPSEYGSKILRGRRPTVDAAAVTVLRASGAVVLGKTVTSEFGMYHPSQTRNPHDPNRSSGVSSSGSAAAVVDGMVPIALGTQHTASTLLPASFCGAFALKPSFGFTSMAGSNILVPRMSQIGFLARSVGDLALFAGIYDGSLYPVRPFDRTPVLKMVNAPGSEAMDGGTREALRSLLSRLNMDIGEWKLPSGFQSALGIVHGLLESHLAFRFGVLPPEDQAQLCQPLRSAMEAGAGISAVRYLDLDTQADNLSREVDSAFDSVDALVTVSALGEAPLFDDGAGSGVMCMPWSLCGLPTVSLPLLRGANNLPIGLQLIGKRHADRELLRVADWIVRAVH